MPIRFKCQKCPTVLQVADTAVGKQVRCTKCQTLQVVPANGTTPAPAQPAPAPPAAPQSTATPKPTAPQAPAPSPAPTSSPAPVPKAPSSSPAAQPAATSGTPAPQRAEIRCPKCTKGLALPPNANGKKVRCPSCQTEFVAQIPSGNTPNAATPTKPSVAPTAAKPTVAKPIVAKPVSPKTPTTPPANSAPNSAPSLWDDPSVLGSQPSTPQSSDPFSFGGGTGQAGYGAPLGDLSGYSQPMSFGGMPSNYGAPAGGAYTPPSSSYQSSPRSSGGGGNSPQYTICGVFLLIIGFFNTLAGIGYCVYFILGFITLFRSPNVGGPSLDDPTVFTITAACIGGLVLLALIYALSNAYICRAGVCMMMKTSLGTVKTGAILAVIPCLSSCTLPFGIWAIVLANSDQARRDFR